MSVGRGAAVDDSGPSAGVPVPEGAAVGVAILSPDLTVTYANPAHTALFGWHTGGRPLEGARAGAVGAPQPDVALTPERLVMEAAQAVLRSGEAALLAEVAVEQRYLQIVCSPVRDGSTTFAVSVVSIDVTEQVQERQRAEQQRQRLSVLDEATSAVTAEVEPRREFIALADSVVPTLADACAIYLIDQASQTGASDIVRATRLVCVIDPAVDIAPPAPEVRLQLAPTRMTAKAARTGRPALASGPQTDPASWGERWLTQLNPHSVVAVPIGTPDAVLAVIMFAATGKRPHYQDNDIALMQQITDRIAAVVGNALRLQRTSEVSLALQRGLLSDPPDIDGLEIRVRYRPAGPGLEIGGDWYDACVLPAGTLGLTVGDVVGHDLPAASTMGQLRSMVQTLACQPQAEPAAILDAVNRLTQHLQVGEFATIVHGHLTPPDAAAGTAASFRWANAGHPPPVLVCPGQPATILNDARSALLGIPQAEYQQASVAIPAGATLMLYTDGLVEDPDRPHADTLTELATTASRHSTAALDELCDKLIATAPSRDDIALLAVRVDPQ